MSGFVARVALVLAALTALVAALSVGLACGDECLVPGETCSSAYKQAN